jgi:Spy/CpxP family protein refolding chaperone
MLMKPVVVSLISVGLALLIPSVSAPTHQTKASAASLREYLSLTDQQQQDLEKLQVQAREKARASVEKLEEKQRALRTQLANGNANPLTVGKLVIELELAKNNAEEVSSQLRSQALTMLTDLQKAKLEALDEARKLQPVAREAVGMFLLAPPPTLLKGTGPLGMFTAPKRGPADPKKVV